MLIISKTPVRLSLFGGGTDYPDFYKRQKGIVLGTTIDKYMYVTLNRLSRFFQYKIRIGYSKTELVNEINEIIHPSVRECLKLKKTNGTLHDYLDIHIFSDLPVKTGLGSSSAFTVGLLNSLYALEGKMASKKKLAEESCFVEQQMIQENVGSQDQFHAAFGGFNVIEFNKSNISVRPVIISDDKLKLLQDSLLLFYTGLTRFASNVLEEQVNKTKKSTNDEFLLKMIDIVSDAENILSSSPKDNFLNDLGFLLDKSWNLKKKLSSKISNEIIDTYYEKAKTAGAYGGKLCGAGSGGFLAILANPNKKTQIREALSNLLEVEYKFENQGSTIIYSQ